MDTVSKATQSALVDEVGQEEAVRRVKGLQSGREVLLSGERYATMRVAELEYLVSPRAFFQANVGATEVC